jgi:hypothetical protein
MSHNFAPMTDGNRHPINLDPIRRYFKREFQPSRAPDCWKTRYRVLLLRHRVWILKREPIPLELFVPHVLGEEFKAMITNKDGAGNPVQRRP